jgi:hypothetical protein
MAQTIKLKRSATQGAVPSTSALALGEIAINTYDGNIFIKKNDGSESIVTIGELSDNAVTSAKIAANAVQASEIATNAVGISELNVSDGTSGQVLTTDGAGSLSFSSKVSTAQSFYLNSATGDGSTTDFSLSTTPAAESNIIAFIDGVFQTQDSYTFSGTTLSFSSAPPNGTEVTVYVVGAIFNGNSVVLDTFSGDDSTTQFTLSENPENENNTQVYIDGVYQQKSEYSVSSQTLTFSSAPPTGTNNIEVVAFSVTNLTVLNANSVSSASIAANAVTSTHIAANQVGISELNLSDGTNGQVITTDGSGTLSFSTISGYTDSDVETYLDGGTSTPTFANATLTGSLRGPATFTIDPAAVGDNTGTLVIAGNLQVDGTTTTINSTTMTVDDLNITLASGAANAAAANGAGITVDGASATITYDGTNDDWNINKPLRVEQNGALLRRYVSSWSYPVHDIVHSAYLSNIGDYTYLKAAGNTANSHGALVTADSVFAVGTTDVETGDIVNSATAPLTNTWLYANSSGLNVNGTISSGAITSDSTVTSLTSFNSTTGNDLRLNAGSANRDIFMQVNGSTLMTIQGSTGSVGINRTPSISSSKLEIGGADNVQLIALEASGYTGGLGIGATGLQFFTDSTVRSKIDITGEFLINRANGFGTAGACALFVTGRSAAGIYVTGPNTSGYPLMTFYNGGLNAIGSITNSNNNATLYNTTSDYRLKENVDYTWDATTRLKQLKPARFNWISDETDTTVDGFLAHEVSSIVPEAITGSKDATKTDTNCVLNSEGNLQQAGVTEAEWTAGKEDGTYDADTTWTASHTQNVYQGIDHSKLVPLLVKTIQELEERITTLENA